MIKIHRPKISQTEFRFIGPRRAGNHAVIFWILKLLEGNYAYFNNVWPNDPYAGEADIKYGDQEKLDYSILSYEDRYLPLISRNLDSGISTEPHATKIINVLLLRDPFNLFASRLKKSTLGATKTLYQTGMNPVQLFIHYSREYCGKTCYLGPDLVRVSFNKWKNDEVYRMSISEELGLNYKPVVQESIPDYGGGSSFQGRGKNLGAKDLKTDSRWRYFSNDQSYKNMFKNREVIDFGLTEFKLERELREWVEDSLMPNTSRLHRLTDHLNIEWKARIFMWLRFVRDRVKPV